LFFITAATLLLEQLHFETGQQFICAIKENGIHLIPKLTFENTRGLLQGANPHHYRDREDLNENTKEKTPLKPRIAGLGQGSIRTTEDFDQPLPDSFWLGEQ